MSSEENGIVRYEKKDEPEKRDEVRFSANYNISSPELYPIRTRKRKKKKCAYATGLNASI
jgi:hypothetical protein